MFVRLLVSDICWHLTGIQTILEVLWIQKMTNNMSRSSMSSLVTGDWMVKGGAPDPLEGTGLTTQISLVGLGSTWMIGY